MEHLWTNAPAPPEYTKYLFCRYIWHCTPEEFDRQDVREYLQVLTILNAETEYHRARDALG